MRIVLLGQPSARVAGRLAERLQVPHIARDTEHPSPLEVPMSGFVLTGAPETLAEAKQLDRILEARAAGVDAVFRFGATEALVDHYRGHIVEVDEAGSDEELVERMLGGLREVLLAA